MERHIQRCSNIEVRGGIGKRDSPRHVRWFAVTAAGHQAPQTAYHVAESDPGRKQVSRLPQRQLVLSQLINADENRCDEAAVEDAARTNERHEVLPTACELLEVDDKQQGLR